MTEHTPIVSFRVEPELLHLAREAVGEPLPNTQLVRLALAHLAGVDVRDYELARRHGAVGRQRREQRTTVP